MAEMTSRERVWAALNHQKPDRVPLDIGGGASTTIVVEGYEKLKQHLADILDSFGVRLDGKPFFHQIDARCNQSFSASGGLDIDQAETAGAVRSYRFILA